VSRYNGFYNNPADWVPNEASKFLWLNENEIIPSRVVSKRSPAGYAPFEKNPMDTFIESFTYTFEDEGVEKVGNITHLLAKTFTDGVMILHKGKNVYEKYFQQEAYSRHKLNSATKSYLGVMAQMIVNEGLLNDTELVTDVIPEMQGSGLEGATIRHVMDMTTEFQWNEGNCFDLGGDWDAPLLAAYAENKPYPLMERCEFQPQYQFVTKNMVREPEDNRKKFPIGTEKSEVAGPKNMREFLTLLKKSPNSREHGKQFSYRTANTDLLAWALDKKLAPKSTSDYFEERLWSKVGQGSDMLITIDDAHVPYWGAGASATLEDFARFGQMLHNDGKNSNGDRVVPEAVVNDIRNPPAEIFAQFGEAYGGSTGYRNQFYYGYAGGHLTYNQLGFYGQYMLVIPQCDMVLAKQSRDQYFLYWSAELKEAFAQLACALSEQ